jgi:hypothetical protein
MMIAAIRCRGRTRDLLGIELKINRGENSDTLMDKTNSLPTMKRAGDKKIILGLMSLSWNYILPSWILGYIHV